MGVRAKVRCYSIAGTDEFKSVRLMPVVDDSDENKTWSAATPSGDMRLDITNPNAFDQFREGEEYFVDFTRASSRIDEPIGKMVED